MLGRPRAAVEPLRRGLEIEEDPRARFMTLAREVQAHFAAKEYEKAEEGCEILSEVLQQDVAEA